MKRFASLLSVLLVVVLAAPPAAAAKKVVKPSAPTIASITSSPVKKGKVNLTVVVTLGADNGGAVIKSTKISAGGKSCTAKKRKTTCTIKGIKNGKTVKVTAKSKNKKGFGAPSLAIKYKSGSSSYALAANVATAPAVAVEAPAIDRIDCSLKRYITPCYCTKYFPETTEYYPGKPASENPCSQRIEGITKTWEWYCSFWGLSFSVIELDCIQSTSTPTPTPTPTPTRTPTPTPTRALLPYSDAIARLIPGLEFALRSALGNSLSSGDIACAANVMSHGLYSQDYYNAYQDLYRTGSISEYTVIQTLESSWRLARRCNGWG